MKKFTKLLLFILILIPLTTNAQVMKATDYIQKIADDAGGDKGSIDKIGDTDLAYDGTEDNNLRYVGATPNNYIYFNDELWRIIGVMNNIDDGTGKKETRLKLVKNDIIGTFAWNANGTNRWDNATLMKMLNPGYESEGGSIYWNSTRGNCYKSEECDFTETGIKEEYRKMVGDAVWYSAALYAQFGSSRPNVIYIDEKNDDPIIWTGKIGLIYPSDKGFSTNGDDTRTREECLDDLMYFWNESRCYKTTFYYGSSYMTYPTIVRIRMSSNYIYFSMLRGDFSDTNTPVTSQYNIYPSLYLNSDVKIYSGDGSKDNPYIIKPTQTNSVIVSNSEEKGEIQFDNEDISSLTESDKISFKITPKQGYKVKKVEAYDDENNSINIEYENETYSFIMPCSDVRLIIEYDKISSINNNPETGISIISIIILIIGISILIYPIYRRKKIMK